MLLEVSPTILIYTKMKTIVQAKLSAMLRAVSLKLRWSTGPLVGVLAVVTG